MRGDVNQGKRKASPGHGGQFSGTKGAAIETDRRYNGREQAKFRKKKVTEMSNCSDWHRRSASPLAYSKWQGKRVEWKVGLETGTSQKRG
jgi:hypothetical protein